MSTKGTPLVRRPHSHILPLTVKLKLADYERLRAEAASNCLSISAYIRQKALTGTVNPPIFISPICQAQWLELVGLTDNLNRLLYLANSGMLGAEVAALLPMIQEIKAKLKVVRDHLIGCSPSMP
jgi:hypothetical protein